MNFKQVLIHEEPVYNEKKKKEFMSWEDVNLKIKADREKGASSCKKSCFNKYEVLSENDSLLYEITNELKERFEFKGLLNNCNVSKLVDTFAKNMNLEEILDDEDEDDNVLDEEDINF